MVIMSPWRTVASIESTRRRFESVQRARHDKTRRPRDRCRLRRTPSPGVDCGCIHDPRNDRLLTPRKFSSRSCWSQRPRNLEPYPRIKESSCGDTAEVIAMDPLRKRSPFDMVVGGRRRSLTHGPRIRSTGPPRLDAWADHTDSRALTLWRAPRTPLTAENQVRTPHLPRIYPEVEHPRNAQ